MARKRLTGEEARSRILDAAVDRLREHGPGGLKLTALAKELGISHQAILHHFGSKDGLVAAVVKQAMEGLQAELVGGLRVVDDPGRGAEVLIERAFSVMADQGYGRLMAWLALGDHDMGEQRHPLALVAEVAHALREREHPGHTKRDTTFTIILLTYAILGSAVFEEGTFRAAGLEDDEATRREFRGWLRDLILAHLESEP